MYSPDILGYISSIINLKRFLPLCNSKLMSKNCWDVPFFVYKLMEVVNFVRSHPILRLMVSNIVSHVPILPSKMGLTLLSYASLSLEFWDDAFSTATFLINRLPTAFLSNCSPLEKLFGLQPNYTFFKTFGCLCYPSLRSFNSHKLDPRSTPCIFLGYSTMHRGYKCLTSQGRLIISRHVLFNETKFPTTTFLSSKSRPHPPLK